MNAANPSPIRPQTINEFEAYGKWYRTVEQVYEDGFSAGQKFESSLHTTDLITVLDRKIVYWRKRDLKQAKALEEFRNFYIYLKEAE